MTFHFYTKEFLQLAHTDFGVWWCTQDDGRSLPLLLLWRLQTFQSLWARQEATQIHWTQFKGSRIMLRIHSHWTRCHVGLIQTWELSPLILQTFVLVHRAKETIQQPQGSMIFDACNIINCLLLGRVEWDRENFHWNHKQVDDTTYSLGLTKAIR